MRDTQFIYYYSKKELKKLKSAVAKGVTKEQEDNDESFSDRTVGGKVAGSARYLRDILTFGSLALRYFGHDHKAERGIMFSLDPIPLDIASLYDNKHKFWVKGEELFEYKVVIGKDLVEGLKGNFQLNNDSGLPYRIVGTKAVRDLMYEKQEWNWEGEMDAKLIKKYEKEIVALEKSKGFYGFWGMDLIKTIEKAKTDIKTTIKENMKLLTEHKQESMLYGELYPWVPHLILYPGFLPIAFDEVKQIKLK